MYVCMYGCMCVCMYACMYVCLCMYVCMCMYVYVCMYVSMCVCVGRGSTTELTVARPPTSPNDQSLAAAHRSPHYARLRPHCCRWGPHTLPHHGSRPAQPLRGGAWLPPRGASLYGQRPPFMYVCMYVGMHVCMYVCACGVCVCVWWCVVWCVWCVWCVWRRGEG